MVSIARVFPTVPSQAAQSRPAAPSNSKDALAQTSSQTISASFVDMSDQDDLIYEQTKLSARSQEETAEIGAMPSSQEEEVTDRYLYSDIKQALMKATNAYERVKSLISLGGMTNESKSPEAIALADQAMVQQAPEVASSIRIHRSVVNHFKLLINDTSLSEKDRRATKSILEAAENRLRSTIKIAKTNYQVIGSIDTVDSRGLYVVTDFSFSYGGQKVY